jgi:hypothetical protein
MPGRQTGQPRPQGSANARSLGTTDKKEAPAFASASRSDRNRSDRLP